MDAALVLLAFAALIVAAALFVRLRLGTALRDGRIPDPPPGRFVLFLELAVLVFLCHLIPMPGHRPGPRQGHLGDRDRQEPTREIPTEPGLPRGRVNAERRSDEPGGEA